MHNKLNNLNMTIDTSSSHTCSSTLRHLLSDHNLLMMRNSNLFSIRNNRNSGDNSLCSIMAWCNLSFTVDLLLLSRWSLRHSTHCVRRRTNAGLYPAPLLVLCQCHPCLDPRRLLTLFS